MSIPPRVRPARPQEISEFIQLVLRIGNRERVGAVEAARWLDVTGILRDSTTRRGLPLRKLLRGGKVAGQHQQEDGRWFIRRLPRRIA